MKADDSDFIYNLINTAHKVNAFSHMIAEWLEGLKNKRFQPFSYESKLLIKQPTVPATVPTSCCCCSRQISCHCLLKYRDKRDKKDKMPQAIILQGLRAFFVLGQNWDKNGQKYNRMPG